MITTNRIISEFDVELQLGAGWFLTAFRGLNDRGLLLPGGPPAPFDSDAIVTIESVEVSAATADHDLVTQVMIQNVPLTILISLELSDDGSELIISNSVPDAGPITVPFDALSGLAGAPKLLKVQGDEGHDSCIVFLANLDLRASPQNQEPLVENEQVERGRELALSFLPTGQDIAVGIGALTFPRIANDIWHDSFRVVEEGGAVSHPFPDVDDAQGSWESAKVEAQDGRIHITLKADVPVTGPDADVTITIDMIPEVNNGLISFRSRVDTDVDTGLLGSLFAFFAGSVAGFFAGLLIGRNPISALIGAGVGGVGKVIDVELTESAKAGAIKRKVVASFDGGDVPPIYVCEEGVVNEAESKEEDSGLIGSFVNAIPRSIPVGSDRSDALFERSVVVEANYDDFQMDEFGMAFAGKVQVGERFQPLSATLVGRRRENDVLQSLVYRTLDNTEVEIPIATVFERMADAELRAPYTIRNTPENSDPRIPAGRLVSVCLTPDAIRRTDTIVQEIHFTNGLDLKVAEAIELQDAGALILRGLQLIRPRDGNPYYRAPANFETEDNFEELPGF
jgi:hypothetical protein